MINKLKDKLTPVSDVPKEFKDRIWLEIVLFALAAPASITFRLFDLKQVSAVLLLTSLFLVGDMARLYYYGFLGHYKILSGTCITVAKHRRIFNHHTEIYFENLADNIVFNTWTNKNTTASEGCQVKAIVPENYNFREADGIRHINTIFLKISGSEKENGNEME